jgi:hypothetical protein
MTSLPTSQPEIVAELLAIRAECGRLVDAMKRLDERVSELLGRLENPDKATGRRIPLAFGKNTITWGTGNVLYIKGKGYKLVKALYEAEGMSLTEEIIGEIIWDTDPEKSELPNHKNFKVFLLRLATRLEKEKFPYRLLPKRSKERFEETEKMQGNKPEVRRIQPEIIGARLDGT